MRFKNVDIFIREASLADIPQISRILTQVGLSTDDILVQGTRYWLVEDIDKQPVGTIGLEPGQDAVLLRSAAILPSLHGQGIGTYLVQHVLDKAKVAGYQHVYLFSTDARTYWQRMGFREVPVSEHVAALPNAPQVQRYTLLGWLPTEVSWRRDLGEQGDHRSIPS